MYNYTVKIYAVYAQNECFLSFIKPLWVPLIVKNICIIFVQKDHVY